MHRVMVVDDDREFLEEITEVLMSSGYETSAFSDGSSAFTEAKKTKPDIILIDLKMEGISGFELANCLKRDDVTKDILLIGMTGFYTEREYEMFINMCGMKECLIKPLAPIDVVAAIEKVLKSTRKKDEK